MPRRQRFARYTITLPTGRGFFDMAGFLDMLRYEGSTVRGWDRQGENFSVDLHGASVAIQVSGSFGSRQ